MVRDYFVLIVQIQKCMLRDTLNWVYITLPQLQYGLSDINSLDVIPPTPLP